MNCTGFKEVADSYLANELLVETNHEILQHLENCSNCRNELSTLRNFREKLRAAVKNAPDSQINPAFVTRLRANLRDEANRGSESVWASLFGLRPMVWAFGAILALGVGFGVVQIIRQNQTAPVARVNPNQTPQANNVVIDNPQFQNAAFVEERKDAIEDHKVCALQHGANEKPLDLNEAAKKFSELDKKFGFDILEPIRESCGNDVKVLIAHSCEANNRTFVHLVLQYHQKIVSVSVAKREESDGVSTSAISCQRVDGFQTSCFQTSKHSIFVISEMDENENLKFARTIEPLLSKRIEKSEQGV